MDMKEVVAFEKPVEVKPQVVMNFSEAIRIGAAMSGPAYGVFTDGIGNTCAQGAALLAIGELRGPFDAMKHHSALRRLWPHVGSSILREVSGMNNNRTHTREQIASWLKAQGL